MLHHLHHTSFHSGTHILRKASQKGKCFGRAFVLQDYFSYFQTRHTPGIKLEADETAYRGESVQEMGKGIGLWASFTMKMKQMPDVKTINI